MKKIIPFLLILFLVVGCSREYTVHEKTITFDQKVDFRHLTYKTSTAFDYGSDGEFRYYNLYDKKQNTIYSVTIEKLKGKYEEDKKKLEENTDNQDVKGEQQKKYYFVSYIKDKKNYHTYYVTYSDDEYYKIEFFNVNKSSLSFEEKFMSYVSLQK